MFAAGTLCLTHSLIRSLPKEELEKKFADAYADWIWLQQEGRHKNDPHYNRLAMDVMSLMEEMQHVIARKSGYRS